MHALHRHDGEGSIDDDSRADAWARGYAMTLQQAVAYALTEEAVTA